MEYIIEKHTKGNKIKYSVHYTYEETFCFRKSIKRTYLDDYIPKDRIYEFRSVMYLDSLERAKEIISLHKQQTSKIETEVISTP